MASGHNPNEGLAGGGRGNLSFSDAEESWHSTYGSNSDPEVGGFAEPRRASSSSSSESDFCSDVELEIKVHLGNADKNCRICHLNLENGNQESGIPIQLGCSCKDDLGAAHKQCAEAWFKIRGNKTCEICGAIARNVVTATEPEIVLEQSNETGNTVSAQQAETRSFWHGHRFLNFLLACMVFAFVISWLLHFNVPS